jgi:hypothetical protein
VEKSTLIPRMTQPSHRQPLKFKISHYRGLMLDHKLGFLLMAVLYLEEKVACRILPCMLLTDWYELSPVIDLGLR